MLYQAGDKIAFGAHYVDSDGISLTGLSVTVNILRVDIDNGIATQVVTNDSVSEAGNGIYYYIYITPTSGNYQFFAVFDEASGNAQVRNLAATAQSGAPWVERIDLSISDISPEKVWSFYKRTLTAKLSDVFVVSAVSGQRITVFAKSTWHFSLVSSLFDFDDDDVLVFGVKKYGDVLDENSLILLRSDNGLQVVNGEDANPSDGELKFDSDSFTVNINATVTDMQYGTYRWFLKRLSSSEQKIVAFGDFRIEPAGIELIL